MKDTKVVDPFQLSFNISKKNKARLSGIIQNTCFWGKRVITFTFPPQRKTIFCRILVQPGTSVDVYAASQHLPLWRWSTQKSGNSFSSQVRCTNYDDIRSEGPRAVLSKKTIGRAGIDFLLPAEWGPHSREHKAQSRGWGIRQRP